MMKVSDNRLPIILFSAFALFLWISLALYMNIKPFAHEYADQHTRQALAWQNGKISLNDNVPYVELAEYKGKLYVSFPPTPTLIAFPLTLIFNRNTPNTLCLLIVTWISLIIGYTICKHLTGNRNLSLFLSFSFFWGTQILYLSMNGCVHYQGLLYGLFFVLLAMLLALKIRKPVYLLFVGISLGFAVGCRPFHLLYLPLLIVMAGKKHSLIKTTLLTIIGMIPMGIFLSLYNYIRFDSIFEFGHNYLPLITRYKMPQFSIKYLPRNLYHTFLKLPYWSKEHNMLTYSGWGTAFYLVSPILILGFPFFFIKNIDIKEKIISGFVLVTIWFLLLLHNTNGWYQFGYRYIVDLVPLFIYFCARYKKKLQPWMIALAALSVMINIYGVYWKYVSPFATPGRGM